MLSYESKFSRHMRNIGNAAEYFMFFKWKSKILVCLWIFYKHFWVQNKGIILFTNHFYLGWKGNSLKIDWDPVGRGAFRENCYDFNETAYPSYCPYYIADISYNRGNTNGFHESYALFFAKV